MNEPYVLFEGSRRDPYAVMVKPHGMPSAPLGLDETGTAAGWFAERVPGARQVEGRRPREYGLLHSLDTDTYGLLLISLTQQAYDALVRSQEKGLFRKYYTAVCIPAEQPPAEGFPPFPYTEKDPEHIESFFRPYGPGRKQVRPVLTEKQVNSFALKKSGTTLYRTEILARKTVSASADMETTVITCSLTKGYRHQIRCHLAWAGTPITGDRLYNQACTGQSPLGLYAAAFEFPHPLTGETVRFSIEDAVRAEFLNGGR